MTRPMTSAGPHSVRAALTGFRKRGIPVTRDKDEAGITVYRVAGDR